MTRTLSTHALALRLAALVCAAAAAAGCTLDKQAAPSLAGPSEFAQAVTLKASPDRLAQDGEAVSAVTANVKDQSGSPKAGVTLHFEAQASDGTAVTMTGVVGVTDVRGNATVGVVAPPAPRFQPFSPVTITVEVTPVGFDFADGGAAPRRVTLTLVPPPGLPPPNADPVADFVIVTVGAAAGSPVTFDASLSRDEGFPCGSACGYAWTFGDGSSGAGLFVAHSYNSPGTFTVTLTVTDARGGVSKPLAKAVVVALPALPKPSLKTSPTGPVAGVTVVNFDASASTAAPGAKIAQYQFIFGDGESVTTSTPFTPHTYALPGTYLSRVIVTDSFGQTVASETTSVLVVLVAP